MKWTMAFVCLWLFAAACNRRCKDPDFVPKLPVMEAYFGMYKPGAWWVYYNTDTTEIDSVYVYDFEGSTSTIGDDKCFQFEIRRFNLKTDYMTDEEYLECRYDNNPDNRGSNLIVMESPVYGYDDYIFYSDQGRDSIIVDPGLPQTVRKYNYPLLKGNYEAMVLDEATLMLFAHQTDESYYMVLGRDIGICQYITNFRPTSPSTVRDTFTLAKYYIP